MRNNRNIVNINKTKTKIQLNLNDNTKLEVDQHLEFGVSCFKNYFQTNYYCMVLCVNQGKRQPYIYIRVTKYNIIDAINIYIHRTFIYLLERHYRTKQNKICVIRIIEHMCKKKSTVGVHMHV